MPEPLTSSRATRNRPTRLAKRTTQGKSLKQDPPDNRHDTCKLAPGVKTRYLYSMSSRLVNVRLDAERIRKARTLRERGIALSDVVREAIDERFAGLRRSESQPDVRALVQRIFEQYPDPPDLPSRDYDVHDRRAARVAIRRKLRPARS